MRLTRDLRPSFFKRGVFTLFLLAMVLTSGLTPVLAAAPPLTAPPPNCSDKKPTPPGDYEFSIEHGGLERDYRVHIPPRYDARVPAPVVIVLHGGYGTGKYIQKQSRMNEAADREGYIGIYPDGIARSWNAGGCCGPAMERKLDDVGFIARLLDQAQGHYCIDPRRVYATGFSNGAMLAHRLACELSDRIAAIAPVSGTPMVSSCTPKRPMSVLIFHGSKDPRSLWDGGLGDKNPNKGVRPAIPAVVNTLSSRYHCAQSEAQVYAQGEVRCSARRACDGDEEIQLCRIEGGGHQWPGGEPVWPGKLGHTTTDISASAMMLEFFKRHPLPLATSPKKGTAGP